MKIKGIQKTTLIDYPGKVACTLFLYGCNFRCGFCHNPELVLEELDPDMKEEDVLDFLERRKKYLEGVCITGGEPLIGLNEEFLKKIRSMGYCIKIDTNGSFPDKLKNFIDEGLVDYIAMDIKSSKERYSSVAGVEVDIEKIERSMKMISALKNYEFRTTILRDIHNEEEMKKIGEWIVGVIGKKGNSYSLQGFKNRGKILNKMFENEKDVFEEDLAGLKKIMMNYFDNVEIKA